MQTSGTVLLGCDKTRGHFNPALSFARYLAALIPAAKIFFYPVKYEWEGLLRKEGYSYWGAPLDAFEGIRELAVRVREIPALWWKIRPARAIGFGGRRSFFAILFLSFFIPTAIYEPNASFGKANLILSFFVQKVFAGFPTLSYHSRLVNRILAHKIRFVGVPLQREYFPDDPAQKSLLKRALGIPESKPVLLAFGGSSGAAFLNAAVYKLIHEEPQLFAGIQVVHFTGKNEYSYFQELYRNAKNVIAKDFSEELWKWYSIADAVICRGGASSLAEINYFSLPSVVIPLPAGYTHQYGNIAYFAERNSIFFVDQHDFDFGSFKDKVSTVLFDAAARTRMSRELRQLKIWNQPEMFSASIVQEMSFVN